LYKSFDLFHGRKHPSKWQELSYSTVVTLGVFSLSCLLTTTQQLSQEAFVRPIRVRANIVTNEECIAYLEQSLWNGCPTCPYCDSKRATKVPQERRYHCNGCNTAYSITVGTVFHNSRVPLNKWFIAIAAVMEDKEPISARELAKRIDVNRNTACSMVNTIEEKLRETRHRLLLEAIATKVLSISHNPSQGVTE
jgi:transposase-like protein